MHVVEIEKRMHVVEIEKRFPGITIGIDTGEKGKAA
jgi:hypothetical protein